MITHQSASASPPGLFDTVRQEMKLRTYSPKTIKSYLGQLGAFVRYSQPRHPRDLMYDDIRSYVLRLMTAPPSHKINSVLSVQAGWRMLLGL